MGIDEVGIDKVGIDEVGINQADVKEEKDTIRPVIFNNKEFKQ